MDLPFPVAFSNASEAGDVVTVLSAVPEVFRAEPLNAETSFPVVVVTQDEDPSLPSKKMRATIDDPAFWLPSLAEKTVGLFGAAADAVPPPVA